jgi:hypothetical protein
MGLNPHGIGSSTAVVTTTSLAYLPGGHRRRGRRRKKKEESFRLFLAAHPARLLNIHKYITPQPEPARLGRRHELVTLTETPRSANGVNRRCAAKDGRPRGQNPRIAVRTALPRGQNSRGYGQNRTTARVPTNAEFPEPAARFSRKEADVLSRKRHDARRLSNRVSRHRPDAAPHPETPPAPRTQCFTSRTTRNSSWQCARQHAYARPAPAQAPPCAALIRSSIRPGEPIAL